MASTIHQLALLNCSEEKNWLCQPKHRTSRHRARDLLWQEYFRDPSQWWDCRNSKLGPSYPDFKHKVTRESLWIDGWFNPPWVCEELRSRVLAVSVQTQDSELFNRNHKDVGTSALASQHGELIHDEILAFVALLRVCTKNRDLHRGTRLHNDILKKGLIGQCADALVTMYTKCGALEKAKELLEMHKCRDIVSWTALITGYSQQGRSEDALNCFEWMLHEGLTPDRVTFACILKVCGTVGALDKGKQIHDEIERQGLLGKDVVLGTALVDMYAKCGALAKARRVLQELPSRDVVSWSALIAGYVQQGQGEQALSCFEQMQGEDLSPDTLTFACILKACGIIGAADKGKQVHDEIVRQRLLENNAMLGNALVDMYVKCGALLKAHQVLEELPFLDVVSWTAIIAGYAHHGQGDQALNCFESMQHKGILPDAVTFACILKACGTLRAADKGKQIHDEIVRQGLLGNNVALGNALVDMYAKCGALAKSRQVLEELPSRDVVSWNALIAGYSDQGRGEQALNCFKRMQQESIAPNAVTFACILKACGTIGAVDKGAQIHDEIARQGLLRNNVVLGNALVDMYAKCGDLAKAQQVLEELPSRDVVLWNTLIAGYTDQGQGEQALNCFERMQHEGIAPDMVTFAGILKACGTIGAAKKGKQIHDEVVRQGLLRNNVVLGSALVDMYAKCGALVKARQVLEELPSRDVVSWNALIAGYAQHIQGEEALNCFERMQSEGVTPDVVTFTCVLNVCSHLGLVQDGHMYFVNMSTRYGIKPNLELCTCMIDLFGRAGHLEKAVGMIQDMPSSDNSAVWHALLSACRKWGDVNVGRWAFEQAVHVDKSDGAAYVLMTSIYAAAGMQVKASAIEAMKMENQA